MGVILSGERNREARFVRSRRIPTSFFVVNEFATFMVHEFATLVVHEFAAHTVPEARLKIARRFNAGFVPRYFHPVPEGLLKLPTRALEMNSPMNATQKIRLEFSEWDLLRSCLNEVTHGFSKSIGDFETVIGVPKPDLERFLDYLCGLPENAVVNVDRNWILVFWNSLSSVLHCIAESEFETRTGHETVEAKNILKRLEHIATSWADEVGLIWRKLTNQLSGFGYDPPGNMTNSGAYVYDDENRLIWTAGYRYIYDADGNRVAKCVAATATTPCPTSGTNGTLYRRSTSGETLDESDLGGNPEEEYIFFNGERIARRDVTSTGVTIAVHYYFSDHLGTHAVVSNAAGTTLEQDIDYYPFGGQQNDYSTAPVPQHYKFTGKERDSESGLDNFGARYDASSLGRFMTPDPLMASAHVSDPQSWNRFAYTLNNPLRFVDPNGMEVSQSCADNEKCQITVKVNVIWDKTANNGKGLTDKQKKDFQTDQIDKAVKDYAKSGIKLDVTYTEGSFTVDSNNNAHYTGLQSDAVNVVASNQTFDGSNESYMTQSGVAITLMNVNDVHDHNLFPLFTNTTEHELAHQFLGDTARPNDNMIKYILNERNVDGRVQGQYMGISQTGFREGLEPRSYANPTNPEAIKPQTH